MALHDFWCQTCGQVLVDINVPIDLGAMKGAPLHCDRPAAWIPQVGRMDAYEPFQEFEARDGQNRPVLVESLSQMRKIERQSEADSRNGDGQPLVWRAYSNDRSNRERHAIHGSWTGGEQPDPAFVKKHAEQIRKGGSVDESYGPGVSDSSPDALAKLEG